MKNSEYFVRCLVISLFYRGGSRVSTAQGVLCTDEQQSICGASPALPGPQRVRRALALHGQITVTQRTADFRKYAVHVEMRGNAIDRYIVGLYMHVEMRGNVIYSGSVCAC